MRKGDSILFSLPGVPLEMQHLFEKFVAPEMAVHKAIKLSCIG